jgi:ADP-heptose:LPS heptosyltransferase
MHDGAAERPPKSIGEGDSLVAIELTRLGDAIVTVRPLMAVERALRPEHLQIVVDEAFASFFRNLFPGAEVHGVRSPDAIAHVLAASGAVRKRAPRLALSWSPALRNGLMTRLSGAPFRAGYLGYSGSHTPFLDRYAATVEGAEAGSAEYHRENIEQRPGKVLEVIGLRPVASYVPSGPVTWSGRDPELGGLRTVVVHPFARWKYREWPQEQTQRVVETLVDTTECTVVVVGQAGDRRRMEQFRRGGFVRERVRLVTPANLEELANVVAGCNAFLGTDSGPLHLASLLGVPTVGLFGPAPPELTGHVHEKGDYVYHPLECSPCRQRHCIRRNAPCMHEITVEEVLDLLNRKISGTPLQMTAA